MIKIEINIDKLSTLSDEDKRGLRATAEYLYQLADSNYKNVRNVIANLPETPVFINNEQPGTKDVELFKIPETPTSIPVTGTVYLETTDNIPWGGAVPESEILAPKKTRTRKPKAEWVAPVVAPIPPPPPSEPEDTTDIYSELVELITENVSTKKLSPKKMLEVLMEFGCQSLPMVNRNRHLVPQITNRFKEFLSNGV